MNVVSVLHLYQAILECIQAITLRLLYVEAYGFRLHNLVMMEIPN